MTICKLLIGTVPRRFISAVALALVVSPSLFPLRADSLLASPARPNLIPQNIVLSSYSARRGDVISVFWTMTNSGSVLCPASFTSLRIGTSPTVPPATDSLNLSVITPEIPAKSAVQQSHSITIPQNLALGTYYLWLNADADGFIEQTSTADDVARSPAFSVATVVVRPNLIAQNVTLSTAFARPGDQVTVAWTITNAANVICPASVTGLHLGTSATTPPTSDGLDLSFPTPELGPNSAFRQTNTITIPSNTALGSYYLWVIADDVPESSLNQTTRADDAARSPALSVVAVLPQPNLIPQNVGISAFSVRRGDQLIVTWTMTNSGTGVCPPSLTGLHLGTSATVPPTTDALNVRFQTPEIPPNSAIRQTNTITIPQSIALGTYFLWVIADDVPNSTLNQTSRADDTSHSTAISVATVVTRPNLIPQNVNLGAYSARPGDVVTIMWTMTNAGAGMCPPSLTGLHLGTSATTPPANDGVNLRISTPEIPANSAIRFTNSVTIPANTAGGTYYLWVVADDVTTSTLNQTSRADDTARSLPIAIGTTLRQPNLAPRNITISPAVARPGDQVTVTWMLTNSGAAMCPASLTGLHLGQSATTRPTTDNLNIIIPTPDINANSAIFQTNVVTIPAGTTLGTYYLWVVADDVITSTLNQTTRADDAAASPALSVVSVITRPNLAPMNITLSSPVVRPGDQVSLSYTITNSGNGNCPASVTGLHIGSSSTVRPTNDSVNLFIPTPAIAAGAAVRQTNNITIPANTPLGTYYLWVVADDVANSTLDQTTRADDAAPSSPLLVANVTLISPASGATVSAPPTFTWTLAGGLTPKVYLANKAAPVLGVDPVVFFDNPPGSNSFTPGRTNWMNAVNTLGVASNYYWTIGSADSPRQIYAPWIPFKTFPVMAGGTFISATEFRFQVVAPQQPQVIIQASENLPTWTDVTTLQNTTGSVTYTESNASGRHHRFYRPKP